MSKKNHCLYQPLLPPPNNNIQRPDDSDTDNEQQSSFIRLPNISQMSFPDLSLKEISKIAPGPEPPDFEIQEANFPKHIHKKQRRKKRKGTDIVDSTQRASSDDIKFYLKFKTQECNDLVADVQVMVHNEFKKTQSRVQSHWRWIIKDTICLEIDMNAVENSEIYRLTTTTNMEKKKFYFAITVEFTYWTSDKTKPTDFFYLIGTESTASKRQRTTYSVSLAESAYGSPPEFKPSPAYSASDVESPSSQQQFSGDVAKYSNIIAERIKTETMEADQINAKVITTPRHDIGYHFELSNDEESFDEGEVVGLLPYGDTKEDSTHRHLRAVKLTNKTASQATLKGVITNSPYIEAYCPKKDSNKRTIIICMLGIVPVQVIGSVRTSEFLYAAPERPGLAISGFHLRAEDKKDATLIGIAVNSIMTKDEISVGIVDAGVSLMQAASQHLVNEKLRDMETGLENKIAVFKKSAIRWRRVFCWMSIVFVVLLFLSSAYIFQLYFPGSTYRKWKCMQGHKKPLYKAQVIYVPYASQDIV